MSLGSVLNVTDTPYGADPLGGIVARTAIQNAIDTLGLATTGGLGLLPPGTYLTDAKLDLVAKVDVGGGGMRSSVIANNSSGDTLSLLGVSEANIAVRDLHLTRSGAGAPNAGIALGLAGGVSTSWAHFERILIDNHVYGIYAVSGEQCTFTDLVVQSCTNGAYLGGSTPGVYCSNYHKFLRNVFQGCSYGMRIVNANTNLSCIECAFYANSTSAIYIPATATGVVTARLTNCWFEQNTKVLDLRGGSGYVLEGCQFSDGIPVIEVANFNHPGLVLRDCSDGGQTDGDLVVAGIDYSLINGNPGYPETQVQVAGAYEPVAYPPMRGGGEKAVNIPADMSTWSTPATGGQADPLGGTSAFSVASGSNANHSVSNVNGGAALGGATLTFQIRVKSNGGRVKLQLNSYPTQAFTVEKCIGLPLNDWRFVWVTYKFAAGDTDTDLLFYVIAESQTVYCYRPILSVSKTPIPELPPGRDMSAWTKPYEVFGPSQNVRTWVNNAAPATGAWAVGDEAVNYAPAAGGTDRWRCTTAGTPGTFKAVAVAA